jgi:hypothetical protein
MAACALATRPLRAGAAAFSASTSVNALVKLIAQCSEISFASHCFVRLLVKVTGKELLRFLRVSLDPPQCCKSDILSRRKETYA